MPDKKPTNSSTAEQAPTPKRPPKSPAHDYSALPQKPIKLKQGVDLPPALKGSENKQRAPAKRTTPPVAKKKRARKSPTKTEQPQSSLSSQALELAAAAAKEEGLSVDAWIEKLIIERSQTPTAEAPSEMASIREALAQINERLWRLESRKGFWRRFWEQYVEPYQK